MASSSRSYINIRAEQYVNRYKEAPYIADWRKNPYTYLKSLFYIETSSIALYFLLKTRISPNTLSVIQGLSGIGGGIFLAIPRKDTVIIAATIFFLKGILDWTDGPLARMTGRMSFTGYVLDGYGALLPYLSMLIGLGFYVAQKSGNNMYFYLIPIIPFAFAANLINYTKIIITDRDVVETEIKGLEKVKPVESADAANVSKKKEPLRLFRRIYLLILNTFDARARGMDLICLLLLIEVFSQVFVTWIVFLFLVFKNILWFAVSFYVVLYRGVAEEELRKQISKN